MAKKVKLTRPELKRYRDMLKRYQRYLPMLKLKQQQLQMTIRDISQQRREAEAAVTQATLIVQKYQPVMSDLAGLNVKDLSKPTEVVTDTRNVAGVRLPVFNDVIFPTISYSLFGTPAWVDQTILDLREVSRKQAMMEILQEQYELLSQELTRIVQRVNLFDKVKIPEAQEAIRKIRIKLSDEMASAVGRCKITKAKLADANALDAGDVVRLQMPDDVDLADGTAEEASQ